MSENNTIQEVKDAITGMAAGAAALSGWSAGQAALIGVKAEVSASARIAQGQEMPSALDAAVPEAEMLMLMDVFCKALDETNDAMAAFDRVVAIKMKATEGVAGADETKKVAEAEYRDALKSGLAPQAAMLSAFLTAGAMLRTIAAGSH
ncbi:hypothetical protein SAMN04515647_2482 [Cohaesibacter sp. ES.047]|uniref:hypothetical protein n=1 Tax=Cohaesibacter sp. ES.047 TaxID=1798205 RepID=UPI000BB91509|nr:hypothetical protein [Cohaesibacter sp. ES.047]SNY92242.1 hypothetical protein SAMN04515647_2482 [Cohaesibacter sp. ES.047]